MKKTLLIMFLLMLSVTMMVCKDNSSTLPSPTFYTSLDEAVAANTGGKDILVDFYTDW